MIEHLAETKTGYDGQQDSATMIFRGPEHVGRPTGAPRGLHLLHRTHPVPGDLICGEGRYVEGDADTGAERCAGIFIGPEFGTVSRPDFVAGRPRSR